MSGKAKGSLARSAIAESCDPEKATRAALACGCRRAWVGPRRGQPAQAGEALGGQFVARARAHSQMARAGNAPGRHFEAGVCSFGDDELGARQVEREVMKPLALPPLRVNEPVRLAIFLFHLCRLLVVLW